MINAIIEKIKKLLSLEDKEVITVFVHDGEVYQLPILVPIYSGPETDFYEGDDNGDDLEDENNHLYEIRFFSFEHDSYCTSIALEANEAIAEAKKDLKSNDNFDYAQIIVQGNRYPDNTEVPDGGIIWDSREPTHILVKIK